MTGEWARQGIPGVGVPQGSGVDAMILAVCPFVLLAAAFLIPLSADSLLLRWAWQVEGAEVAIHFDLATCFCLCIFVLTRSGLKTSTKHS